MTTASSLIAAGSLPTDPEQVWAPSLIFTSNWSGRLEVVTNFRTAIQSAVSTAEQRLSLASLPYREVRASLDGFDPSDAGLLMASSHRAAKAASLVPLYCDQLDTTSPVSAGATVIPTSDTTLSRVSVGGRVVVLSPGMNPSNQHISVVQSKATNSITLTTATASAFPQGSSIIPLIESRIRLTSGGSGLTDSVLSLDLSATEVAGPSQLDLLTGSSFNTHDGLPIFELPLDWARPIGWEVIRQGEVGDAVTVYGSRAAMSFDFEVVCTSRGEAFQTIRFFEDRAGQLKPFWFVSPFSQYAFISRTLSVVRVAVAERDFASIDWMARPYIALIDKNHQIQVRDIVSVTAVSPGVVDVETLNDFTIANSDVHRAAVCYKMRFNSDELTESWLSTRAMRTRMGVVEVLEEKSVTISGFDELESSDLELRFKPGNCSGSEAPPVEGCHELCSDPLLTVRPPARITVRIWAWGYGLIESELSTPGYVGTDRRFDDPKICVGTKLAGDPYEFVYYYNENTGRFEINPGESDAPPCGYTLADVASFLELDCDGFTDNDFFNLASRVATGGSISPPSENGFAFEGDMGGFSDLSEVNNFTMEFDSYVGHRVRIRVVPLGVQGLLVYEAKVEGISQADCSNVVVSDCTDNLFDTDCGNWIFVEPNGSIYIDFSDETLECTDDSASTGSECPESSYDSISDTTELWIGCFAYSGSPTETNHCDPPVEPGVAYINCCYIVVEGDQTGGI
jgi:hypothetical protein